MLLDLLTTRPVVEPAALCAGTDLPIAAVIPGIANLPIGVPVCSPHPAEAWACRTRDLRELHVLQKGDGSGEFLAGAQDADVTPHQVLDLGERGPPVTPAALQSLLGTTTRPPPIRPYCEIPPGFLR